MNQVKTYGIGNVPFQPTIQNRPLNNKATPQSFLQHLEVAAKQLRVSKHATERLQDRQIHISDQEWSHVSNKVQEASLKGVKHPLVLMEQAALIISAKNNTVITAMDRTEAKEQIFTNIDGTIVL